ncbi:MAG: polysaccharide pyruvyl transferase family protein [Candidatus Bathyarchaeota archaeon]|nr:MAG: polysaccharide pyruvyl transferase family protein [Candidatus Bathyarchaeota archaeon]
MTPKNILAIAVLSPTMSKGDFAQYRASVDQLKYFGSVKLSYPGASYDTSHMQFFADIDVLPHPSELALSRNLMKTMKYRSSPPQFSAPKSTNRPSLNKRLLNGLSSFYDKSFLLRQMLAPTLTKSLVSQIHSDFEDIDYVVVLGHTLEKSLMKRYTTSYYYPKFVLKKPTVIFPFSVSHLGLKESPGREVFLMKMILRRIDALFLREERSYKYLGRMIGTMKNLFPVADMAFLLSEAPLETVISKIRRSGVDLKTPSIAVALRPDYFLTYKKRFGLRKLSFFLKKVAKLLDRLISDFKAFVYFVPMVVEPGSTKIADDLYCSKECIRNMKNRERAYIIDTPCLSAYEMKTLLGLMDFLITTRLHAGILAMSKQVPTLMILPTDDNKGIGLSERLGTEEYFIDLDYAIDTDLDKFYHEVSNAIRNRETIREQLKISIPKEQKLASSTMKILQRIVV